MKPFLIFILAIVLIQYQLPAQQYTLNGNASKDNCHCYTITPNSFGQSGSVWNNIKIDLTKPFDFTFDINLGCDDAGADGIVFVLQPISTSVGSTGGGLGFEGIKPSVGVTIDTYQNSDAGSNDPAYDHIAIQLNGNINHQDLTNNIAGPVTALAGSNNIEDCKLHTLRIQWDALTNKLTTYIDGILRVSVVKDFVSDVFAGNPNVFWGFTGSTGGAKNLQQFCTSLTPIFKLLPTQKRCINEPIAFFDSTISFAPVLKNYWDFNDGSPIDSINKNPVHTFIAAGDYTVKQTVIGADGCIEINSQPLRIGSMPVAAIFSTGSGCTNKLIPLKDSSTTSIGTLNEWIWDLGNGKMDSTQNPIATYATAGIKTISLFVKSLEGCVSATVTTTINIDPSPLVDFSVTGSFCKKSNLQFTNLSSVSSGSITSLMYNFGNGQQSLQPNPVMHFDTSKNYNITLTAVTDKGCQVVKLKSVFIFALPVGYFKYNATCSPYVVNFIDSSYTSNGIPVTGWWWKLGNGDTSIIKNPVANYITSGNIPIQLVVKNAFGCQSDTFTKPIYLPAKPVANFGYSSPLCNGQPVLFTDASSITVGNIVAREWLVDGIVSSTLQNPSFTFLAGKHRIQLLVKNDAGCYGDTVIRNIFVETLPSVKQQFADGCKGKRIDFNGINLSGQNITDWEWNFGDNSFAVSKNTQHIYLNTGIYKVQLKAIAITGCYNIADSNITINGTNAFAGNDTIAATNQPIQLQATGGSFYQWIPAFGLNNSNIANPIAMLQGNQQYTIRAYTTAGCESFSSIHIKVYNGPEIYVPKAFTPNGDLTNDQLKAFPVGMRQFKKFTVYNRFGEIVFASNNSSKGWNGFYKGKLQGPGIYVWISSGISYEGIEIVRKGTVVLLQ